MARSNGTRSNRKTSRNNSRIFNKPSLDYSVRYGSNYSHECAIARKTHESLGSICVCCLKAVATQLHHVSYGGKPLNRLYDNLMPVCLHCHQTICHDKTKYWIVDKKNPVWGNHNTEDFKKRLKLGLNILRCFYLK